MQYKKEMKKIIGIIILSVLCILPFIPVIHTYLSIPNQKTVFADNPVIQTTAKADNSSATTPKDKTKISHIINNDKLIYSFSGIPIKKVDLSVLKQKKIIPGGQSIGVKLHTQGVLVVGYHLINKEKSPAEEQGINIGDIIVKINDTKINNPEDIQKEVQTYKESDQPLDFMLKRQEKIIHQKIKPLYNDENHKYAIGVYVRNMIAGIGTLTFIDPDTQKYGALGHMIADIDTQKPVNVYKGKVYNSNITSIEKSESGKPGEKHADFNEDEPIGDITDNSPFGIFGRLKKQVTNENLNKPLPIALPSEVKKGPAKILTVLDGDTVEEFDVEIVNTVAQTHPGTKGLIIHITDPKLLNKTGGIVQGMSGSPIIQNGKLIGAITHVFVNDPTSGYGVHILWMLKEAGINLEEVS